MTNPATDLKTVYIATNSHASNARQYIIEGMSSFDSDFYRSEIARVGVHEVARGDWDDLWTQGDESHSTQDAAQAYADEYGERGVIEVAIEDVEAALLEVFGAPEGYPLVVADINDPSIVKDAQADGIYFARELSRRAADLVHYELSDGTRVIHTNASPVWDSDPAYGDLLEQLPEA